MLKKALLFIGIISLLVCFALADEAYFTDIDAITTEMIEEAITLGRYMGSDGDVRMKYTFDDPMELYGGSYTEEYRYGQTWFSAYMQYENGAVGGYYYNAAEEPYTYAMQQDGTYSRYELSAEDYAAQLAAPILSELQVTIRERSLSGNTADIVMDMLDESGDVVGSVETRLSMQTGLAENLVLNYYYDGEVYATIQFEFSAEQGLTPQNEVLGYRDGYLAMLDQGMNFSCQNLEGNTVTLSDFSDSKLIMVLYWEPYCQPCISEFDMIESMYEKYADQGLVILGVFNSSSMEEDARAILEEHNITFPVVYGDSVLNAQAEEYIPAQLFMTPEGVIFEDSRSIGALSETEQDEKIQYYFSLVG